MSSSTPPDPPRSPRHLFWEIVAFLAPGAAIVGTAVLVDSPGGDQITQGEWITAAVGALVTSAAVNAAAGRTALRTARRVHESQVLQTDDEKPAQEG